MKLSSLFLVPSLLLVPVIAARSRSEWVGDVKSITDGYQKIQNNVKKVTDAGRSLHGEHFFLATALRKSGEAVSAAVNQQQEASESQLLPKNGAESEVSLTSPCIFIPDDS